MEEPDITKELQRLWNDRNRRFLDGLTEAELAAPLDESAMHVLAGGVWTWRPRDPYPPFKADATKTMTLHTLADVKKAYEEGWLVP